VRSNGAPPLNWHFPLIGVTKPLFCLSLVRAAAPCAEALLVRLLVSPCPRFLLTLRTTIRLSLHRKKQLFAFKTLPESFSDSFEQVSDKHQYTRTVSPEVISVDMPMRIPTQRID
jgi:hypothetical protein